MIFTRFLACLGAAVPAVHLNQSSSEKSVVLQTSTVAVMHRFETRHRHSSELLVTQRSTKNMQTSAGADRVLCVQSAVQTK